MKHTLSRHPTPELQILLDLLEEAFDRKSWHGPNLRGSLRGVTPEQAVWRPQGDRHSIRDLALHAAYWKYVARRRLTGEKRGSFALAGHNFFEQPVELSAAAWKQDVRILEIEHQRLREAIADLSAEKWTPAAFHMIRGAAAHDLYHAGQIRLLRRLCPI